MSENAHEYYRCDGCAVLLSSIEDITVVMVKTPFFEPTVLGESLFWDNEPRALCDGCLEAETRR